MYDSEIQLHLHMLQINDTKTTMKWTNVAFQLVCDKYKKRPYQLRN
jgi:hypothetical protein